jgi:hypothetical protein
MTTEGENPRDRADQSRDGRSSWHEDTYAMRLGRLKRRNRQLIAVGAGLTAFVVAVAASAAADSIYDEVPGWLRASIFTLVVAAAGGLSVAWIRFQEEIEGIEDAIAGRPDLATERIGGGAPTTPTPSGSVG